MKTRRIITDCQLAVSNQPKSGYSKILLRSATYRLIFLNCAKILPKISRCHGKILSREPCSEEKFYWKSYLARKNLNGSQQKSTSKQIYIVRHDNFLLARYKIWFFCLFRRQIKLFYQLQNRCQQRCQKSLELNHCPNRDNDHISSSNTAAETRSKKHRDMNLQKIPNFLLFPV